jgi:hypothetical protein
VKELIIGVERTYPAEEKQVQRPWERSMLGEFEKQQGHQCKWSTASKGVGYSRNGKERSKKE